MLCPAIRTIAAHGARMARTWQPAAGVHPAAAAAAAARRHSMIARSGEGVRDLISRDRKEVELTDAFEDAPAAPSAADTQTSSSSTATAEAPSSSATTSTRSSSRRRTAAGFKSRKQRQADMAQAADAGGAPSSSSKAPEPEFKRCKQAIDAGLEAFQAKQYSQAIDLFNLALELPGNGAYRLSGSPREYACPSDAEEHAALYNMACCYAQLGQQAAALTCLESILETGFSDIATINADPDLRPVQGAALQAVINKYTGIGGMFSKLLRKDKEEVLISDSNKNKPWIMW
ncbi:hypothetical protein COO60DRAFT_1501236 [Scenedesmus sp. NREL 46B-D3]|nr:hypothetical protein COO60DRAFT_1501236 [Scenedesmus sp. NREL 46B-D3]